MAAFIPIWSGLAYLAMGLGLGTTEVAGQTAYWARYADWIVTTPLLLVALWMTATTRQEKRPHVPTLITILAADVVMILSGLVADLSEGTARLVYYGIGVAALLVVFWTAFTSLRRIAHQTPEVGLIYDRVATYLALFWIGYPLTWILGPSGLGVVSQPRRYGAVHPAAHLLQGRVQHLGPGPPAQDGRRAGPLGAPRAHAAGLAHAASSDHAWATPYSSNVTPSWGTSIEVFERRGKTRIVPSP